MGLLDRLELLVELRRQELDARLLDDLAVTEGFRENQDTKAREKRNVSIGKYNSIHNIRTYEHIDG